MAAPRLATHLGPFTAGADRFNPQGYRAILPVAERLRRVAAVPGLDAVELNFRSTVCESSASTISALLEDLGVACANISLNVWGEPCWGNGSLTNPDPAIRESAVELITAGMRTARELGCRLVSLWPGQDGLDYPFETDYARQLDWFVEGLQACLDSVPEVRLCIEYKPKEPRTHLLVDTAARVMWLLTRIARSNVGVLLDVGHGFAAGENVAQSAVLLQREGWLDLIHFNDNPGDWDWDMIPGTLRFLESLELIYWLQELDYQGYYSIDISVPRADPVEAICLSVSNIRQMFRLAEKLDRPAIRENLCGRNPVANLKLVTDLWFGGLER